MCMYIYMTINNNYKYFIVSDSMPYFAEACEKGGGAPPKKGTCHDRLYLHFLFLPPPPPSTVGRPRR